MDIRNTINKLEKLHEGLGDEAHIAEKDHEVQMARSDLYKVAKYAVQLHGMLKNVSEQEGLEGWVQAKITKAADYLSSVKHYIEGADIPHDAELAIVQSTDTADIVSERKLENNVLTRVENIKGDKHDVEVPVRESACTLQCKYCNDMLGQPTTDCEYNSMDPKGDNWVMVDIDGDGDADIAVQSEESDVSRMLELAGMQQQENLKEGPPVPKIKPQGPTSQGGRTYEPQPTSPSPRPANTPAPEPELDPTAKNDPYGKDRTQSLDTEFSKKVAKQNADNIKNVNPYKSKLTQSKFNNWSKK
jgi:hypothetical protein